MNATTAPQARKANPLTRWLKDPWRKPRVLWTITWSYLAWSILPVLIAVVFSFNNGRSRSAWQGFSLQWWVGNKLDQSSLRFDSALRASIGQSLRLAVVTMVISVPLGVLFAIGLDRWRGRISSGANFAMLFSFVIPEIILGVSLYLLFTQALRSVMGLGTTAQIIGLVTFQISYPVIIVRARLLSIGKEYEEAAMDLGATPTQSVRRVLLPLLYPAVFASFAIVFADSLDDFVTVNALKSGASTQTLSISIYNTSRGSPTPAINAAATAMLIFTLTAVGFGLLLYRYFSRGQRGDAASFTQL